MSEQLWYLYLIEAVDQRLYTGISTDPERRLAEHTAGRGARFLRGRGPLKMRYCQSVGDRSTALRLEYRVKQLSRGDKLALIAGARELPEL